MLYIVFFCILQSSCMFLSLFANFSSATFTFQKIFRCGKSIMNVDHFPRVSQWVKPTSLSTCLCNLSLWLSLSLLSLNQIYHSIIIILIIIHINTHHIYIYYIYPIMRWYSHNIDMYLIPIYPCFHVFLWLFYGFSMFTPGIPPKQTRNTGDAKCTWA